ncbi:MAG: ParB/RepB/Spo0J family partition protein [Smithellaceae bacterium]
MSIFETGLDDNIEQVVSAIDAMPDEEKIDAINRLKTRLHEISPFKSEPVDCVLWVRQADVIPNDYNPNSVAPPEMRLLQHSISCDGYTQPIVSWHSGGKYNIVDGEHRYRVGSTVSGIRKRLLGRLPVTVIKPSRGGQADRMAATIRHNRARGTHAVGSMTDIVAGMLQGGLPDEAVAKELGMDADEFLRFKQNSGMPELFKHHDYSKAWEII